MGRKRKMRLNEILAITISRRASDIHLKVGSPPAFRIGGNIVVSNMPPLTSRDIEGFVSEMGLKEGKKERLKKTGQVDVGYGISGAGRFRLNIYYQRGSLAIAGRFIPYRIPSMKELNLPEIIEKIALSQRGLILVTGVAGSGKSTTLAAMVEIINKDRTVNIITVEDPIEYLFSDNKAIISQRQIGDDVSSFAEGLKGALRQDPNVILVGEMRDRETMHMALEAAETGHVVISTLHTLDAVEAVNRIISAFPLDQENQIRKQLSATLTAVICQRLIENIDKTGLVPATEVMIATEYIRAAISDPEKTSDIPRIIEMNRIYGMQTFDQSLMDLYERKFISLDKAREYATHSDDFILKAKGIQIG